MRKCAVRVVKTIQEAGFQAVFAGGCVRDQFLGLEPHDYDIATNATPDQIEALFDKTVPIGKSFGVIDVLVDNLDFQIATFRSDGKYSDGRHPDDVTFSSMEEDAKRRDLTINGMFYDPIADRMYDFVGGQKDLEAKKIRLIGCPKCRIDEDLLRMMRVIRFAARFNFAVEFNSFRTVCDNAHLISQVSVERVADELVKILSVENKKQAIDLLFETGLMAQVVPEFIAMKGCEQPVDYHPEGCCACHTIKAMQNLENPSSELLIATFLHDIGKPPTQKFEERIRFDGHDFEGAKMTEAILRRLKFSNEFIEHTVSMVRNHMKFMHVKEMRKSRLKRFMNLPKFEEHLALHKADCMSSHEGIDNYEFIIEQLKTFKAEPEKNVISKLPRLVTGHDLIAMGFIQGSIFRTILTDIEDQQLEEKLSTKEEAVSYIEEKYLIEKIE